MSFTPSLSGVATLTHYTLPSHYIASCGCVGTVTDYPTAAINRLAYDSDSSFGPRCGSCVKLTLQTTPLASSWDPIDYSQNGQNSTQKAPSVVVKLVDACPIQGEWCNSTMTQGNKLGYQIHFDLAWPSKGISDDFFPGEHDYGVWTSLYEYVSCTEWDGYSHEQALGSDWGQSNAACCPANPPLPSTPDDPSTTSSTQELTPTSLSTSSSIATSSVINLNSTTTNSTTNSTSSSNSTLSASRSSTSIPLSSTQSLLTRRSNPHHHHRQISHLHSRDLSILNNPDQFKQCPSYSSLIGSSNQGITPDLNSMIPNTSNILSKNDDASNGALGLNNLFSLLNFKGSNEDGSRNSSMSNLKNWFVGNLDSKSNFGSLIKRSTSAAQGAFQFNWKDLRGKLWMRDLQLQEIETRDGEEEEKVDLDKTFGGPPLLKVPKEL